MTVMRTIQDDVNSLAMHVLDVADYASGIEAKAKDDLTVEIEKLKGEMQEAFDAKLEAFKKEIMGDVETEASKAVADLGAKVAELGKAPAAVETKAEPAPAPEPSSGATVTTSPTGATVTVDTAAGTTTHVADEVTTTVDHASGVATAVDASVTPAQPVEPAPAAVAEAVSASADAGVTVPAAEPVIATTIG